MSTAELIKGVLDVLENNPNSITSSVWVNIDLPAGTGEGVRLRVLNYFENYLDPFNTIGVSVTVGRGDETKKSFRNIILSNGDNNVS